MILTIIIVSIVFILFLALMVAIILSPETFDDQINKED